jgi:hypothetical protein
LKSEQCAARAQARPIAGRGERACAQLLSRLRRAVRNAGRTATIAPDAIEIAAAKRARAASNRDVADAWKIERRRAHEDLQRDACHGARPRTPPVTANSKLLDGGAADQAGASRAERRTEIRRRAGGPSRGSTRVGEVRTGNQQDRGDGAEEQQQAAARFADQRSATA